MNMQSLKVPCGVFLVNKHFCLQSVCAPRDVARILEVLTKCILILLAYRPPSQYLCWQMYPLYKRPTHQSNDNSVKGQLHQF